MKYPEGDVRSRKFATIATIAALSVAATGCGNSESVGKCDPSVKTKLDVNPTYTYDAVNMMRDATIKLRTQMTRSGSRWLLETYGMAGRERVIRQSNILPLFMPAVEDVFTKKIETHSDQTEFIVSTPVYVSAAHGYDMGGAEKNLPDTKLDTVSEVVCKDENGMHFTPEATETIGHMKQVDVISLSLLDKISPR